MRDLDPVKYERRDISLRAVSWFAMGMVAALVIIFVGVRILEKALSGGRGIGARTQPLLVEVPPPRLQSDPAADLATLRSAEEKKLHSYGWVDRKAGLIRI